MHWGHELSLVDEYFLNFHEDFYLDHKGTPKDALLDFLQYVSIEDVDQLVVELEGLLLPQNAQRLEDRFEKATHFDVTFGLTQSDAIKLHVHCLRQRKPISD